ncbi:MAG TPA: hybrid sensor histidine kinase/response regulator, partial [Desulfobacterales bacterium]|nr:hybrid sensor histidine kinase/response regulator [Desulfobacterales bacterium]
MAIPSEQVCNPKRAGYSRGEITMDGTNKKFNILIVDDASKNIQVVANILKQEGYQMAFARNGKTALSRAETMPFDLILLDIMMPEMDGYEACERLKKNPETKDIPVIFLTAKTDKESVLKGFGLGAVDYVTKPFNAAELLARVKTHLELKLAKEDLRNSRDQLQELNATKDKFFSIIAHDLRNPFNALISGSDMLVHYFEELEQEQIKDFIGEINLASRQAFNLLGNLLEWARSQTGRILYTPEKISMDDIVQENMDLLEQNAKEKNIHITNDVEADTFAYADKDMISTVIR